MKRIKKKIKKIRIQSAFILGLIGSGTLLIGILSLLIFSASPVPSPITYNDSPQPTPAPTSAPAPRPVLNSALPQITAGHVIILDRDSQTVLYQNQADTPVPPASTTKIMTALVVLENLPLNRQITVTSSFTDGQVAGFLPGETFTVEQLLYAMLVQSANDAAETLAENFTGGRISFIAAMNAKAKSLHLYNTNFINPTGLDEDNHYSSASDLARLADVAMKNQEFSRIVATENTVLPGNHVFTNVNELLSKVPGVLGIKTGFTDNAGQALVTLVNQGHTLIIVVLKSTDRFDDTQKLIRWAYSSFTWTPPGT